MSSELFKAKAWLPIAIVIIGIFTGYQILSTDNLQPIKALKKQQKQQKRARTVQVVALEKGDVEPIWRASGYVMPSESIKVYARVSGDVATVNSIAQPGKLLKAGDWLVKLDATDFELSLKSQQAELAQTHANLALEQAAQVLAKEELALLNQSSELSVDPDLVLRQPQLAVAQAKVAVAENKVEKAIIEVSRTQVVMPFDGIIIDKFIGRGSKVSANTEIFSVTNTQQYWLEVKVPFKFLALLDQSDSYKVVQERVWGKDQYRLAQFISVLAELDTKDRQVKLLLAIEKPLAQQQDQPQVFLNDFVNVELTGKAITNAWVIKHHWLQPDNTIWVVDSEQTLQKRVVKVLFKGRDVIYIDAEFKVGDLALAEKPGIVHVGLPVKVKRLDKPKVKRKRQTKKQTAVGDKQ